VQSGGAGDSHTDSDANSFTYSHSDRDNDADPNAHRYANCDRHSDSDSHGYCDTNSDPDTKGQSNANSNRYSHSQRLAEQLRSGSRLLEKSRGVAGQRIAAWQRDLQSAGVAIDSGKSSPHQWPGLRRASGDRGKTEHSQRRGRKLYPTNIG